MADPAAPGAGPAAGAGTPISVNEQHQGSGAGRLDSTHYDRPGTYDGRRIPPKGDIGRHAEQVEKQIDSHAVVGGQVVEDRGKTVYTQWPTKLVEADPQDQHYHLRSQFIKTGPGNVPYVEGQGVAMVGEDYFAYQDRKRKMLQRADFESWLMSQVDYSSPEKVAYWKEKFPRLFEARESLWKDQQEIQSRFALIQMRGPQDEDDYILIYMLQRGLLKLPKGPLWQPSGVLQDTFERGLFNWKRFFPAKMSDNTPSYVGQFNYANPLSDHSSGRSWFVPANTTLGNVGAPSGAPTTPSSGTGMWFGL